MVQNNNNKNQPKTHFDLFVITPTSFSKKCMSTRNFFPISTLFRRTECRICAARRAVLIRIFWRMVWNLEFNKGFKI